MNESLQARVQPWMMACFGPEISADKVERGDRLLEEVFELLQSGGYDPARVLALRDYVWNREAGEPSQEAGGVQITLAAYCLAHDLDMHEAGETELARIWTKVDKIRAKQAARPVGSALPVALAPAQAVPGDMVSSAIADIASERQRQISAEGWTPEHDDAHSAGELAAAAACYAASAKGHGFISLDRAPSRWPWSLDWWKPTDRRRDLVKAGALIAAEIERLDRLAGQVSPASGRQG
ncbi:MULTISPECIES: hypothetical protein [unclassified Mesorhizobium]|uniref:hypothetical protein n=1 Tax=unclassified Mesorhizobium TaxID=325217 RepID=UPI0019D039D8|nr:MULTISPECIES: hypothetical protein [unclassified Mesorhizobium]